jgi:predicted secreted Zn-dependent protease
MKVRLILVALFLSMHGASAAEWKPVERIEAYAISGATGIALYRSIGEHGPKIGKGRVIAYTDFKLLWSRDYRPQPDGSCVLASARPSLTITYRLPKPSGELPPPLRDSWARFRSGIEAHEREHGAGIVEMVRAIEATSVGLTVADDPKCRKIRQELTGRLAELSREQRRKSREFDQIEMSDGGNVHRLILALVNGE